ncbi:MAG: FixH family protein [Syntrophales bacterium]|nr:FixH family protein [Syntrophales bacterium]
MRALIIIVSIIVLSAVAGSIIIGVMTFDEQVTEKPYETGLLWDQIQKEKEASGLSVSIMNKGFTAGDNELVFSVAGREGRRLSGVVSSVLVSRPSTSAYDRVYPVADPRDGLYRVKVHLPLYGYWVLKTEVSHNGGSLTFEEKIFAEKGQSSSEKDRTVCEIDKGPCSKKYGEQEVILDIDPRPVRAMKELVFTVSLKQGNYENLLMALDMPGMHMGRNEVVLKKTDARYTGKGVIPRCASGMKQWRANINIPETGKVDFLFNVSY